MNEADSRRLAAALEHLGYAPVSRAEEADVIVLNTCVVRQQAEDKVYGRLSSLRPLKARRPDVVIGLMGCLVGRRDPAPLRERFPWVDVFAPPSDPGPLLDHLAERGLADAGRALSAEDAARRIPTPFLLPRQERGRQVTAYVPAVLGCSHACTYCIIPTAGAGAQPTGGGDSGRGPRAGRPGGQRDHPAGADCGPVRV
jgi:tRNA-2-methylthio-N6-dimethylallyladenosine synthase